MSLPLSVLVLFAGFVLLIKGAGWLVDGASVIARSFGMSDLMIGLTIVAFGTSAPELLVNIMASIEGNADLVMGDVLGSNIANTLFVLGLAASIRLLNVQTSTVWKEIPLNILAGAVLFVMISDQLLDGSTGIISRSEGVVLISFFIIFLYYTFLLKKDDNNEHHTKEKDSRMHAILIVTIGCIILPLGGKFVVMSAETIARAVGVSEALIGLTIVALGTSLPEAAAACVAAWRGKADIAVGNVVGSNIFNIFWILGISAIIRPIAFTTNLTVDVSLVLFSSVILFYLVHTGPLHYRFIFFWRQQKQHLLQRKEGWFLLALYATYIIYIGWRG